MSVQSHLSEKKNMYIWKKILYMEETKKYYKPNQSTEASITKNFHVITYMQDD